MEKVLDQSVVLLMMIIVLVYMIVYFDVSYGVDWQCLMLLDVVLL